MASASRATRSDANCDYKKAPFFNVLAAFWIQFMTHDWFSHLEEGQNAPRSYMKLGCTSQKVNGVETAAHAGGDRAARMPSGRSRSTSARGRAGARRRRSRGRRQDVPVRAPKTFRNTNTAWWDASQIYGYDERSRKRVKRDPNDPARAADGGAAGRTADGDKQGYLPVLERRRSDESGVGGPGSDRVPGQLDHRDELLPQRVRAGAQPVRRRFRAPAAQTPDADSGPAQSGATRPGDPLPGRDARRAVRGRAAGGRRRDREDPHHRVDHAAALRRAAVSAA